MINKLVQANKTGSISTTKFWYNIACAVATYVIVWYAYGYKLTWEMFSVYLIAVGGFSSLSKFIIYRFQEPKQDKES